MSRSWERMVQKNSAQLNKQRKKQGKPSLYSSNGSATADVFKGRNFVLPITLVALAVIYLLLGMTSQQAAMNTSLNWIVVGLYVLLAIMIFLRRPFLKVDKNTLSTIKFNRDRLFDGGPNRQNQSRIRFDRDRNERNEGEKGQGNKGRQLGVYPFDQPLRYRSHGRTS